MKTLVNILKRNKWDCDKDPNTIVKDNPGHTYLEVYDRLFSIFKDEPINILEIGVLRGVSLKLWHKYFTKANIYGMDTFERTWDGCTIKEVQENLKQFNRIQLFQVNSCSIDSVEEEIRNEWLTSIPDNFFHIIIDDGSHELSDQIDTFLNFKSKLHFDGIYVIEDIGWTREKSFDPSDILIELPELKLVDMRFPGKVDNVLALYYNSDSKNYSHFESYYQSDHWKTAYEFSMEYILKKKGELNESSTSE